MHTACSNVTLNGLKEFHVENLTIMQIFSCPVADQSFSGVNLPTKSEVLDSATAVDGHY